MKPKIVFSALLFLFVLETSLSGPIAGLDRVVTGLGRLSDIAIPGDGTGRIFAAELSGQVRVIRDGVLLKRPFLDIKNRVSELGEGGLIGLAFHPRYAENGRFFVVYTAGPEDDFRTVIAEYKVADNDPDRADNLVLPLSPSPERIIMVIAQPTVVHQAGDLAFGPDGMLYISSGDGGPPGRKVGDQAQDLGSLLGKILRIDVDAEDRPYRVPLDNPFVGQEGARPEIWAYGLRNPFRMGFDRGSGRLFLGDVGDSAVEEVNLVVKGGNYGWPRLEGSRCFPPEVEECDHEGIVPAIHEFSRTDGKAVIGGLVYRGPQPTSLFGAYIFADFVLGRIWALQEASRGVWQRRLLAKTVFPVAFAEDEAGDLYIAENLGTISRISFLWREVLAQITDGDTAIGRFRSSIRIANDGEEEASGELFFVTPDGVQAAMTIDDVTDTSFRFTIPAKSARILKTDGISDPFFPGWAVLFSERRLKGSVILQLSKDDQVSAEAGSTSSPVGREYVAAVNRSSSGVDTAVAVVNPSLQTELSVRLSLQGPDEIEIGSLELMLDPLEQRALFVNQIAPLPPDFQGTIVIESLREFGATVLQTLGGIHSAGL